MATKELLTVKEVADLLGITVQAVYSRLEKDLKPYLKIENGKKRLDKRVLSYIRPQENSSDFSSLFQATLKILELQNEQLSKELGIKNKQIDELNARLAEAYQMANQAQQLHGADKVLELQGGADPVEQEAQPKKQGLFSRFFGRV